MIKSNSIRRRFLTVLGIGVAFSPLAIKAQTSEIDNKLTSSNDMPQTTTFPSIVVNTNSINPIDEGYRLVISTIQSSKYSSCVDVIAEIVDGTGNIVPIEGDIRFYNTRGGIKLPMSTTPTENNAVYTVDYSQPEDNNALIEAEYYINGNLIATSNSLDVTNLGLVSVSVEFVGLFNAITDEYDYKIIVENYSEEELINFEIDGKTVDITGESTNIRIKSNQVETINCKVNGKDGNYTPFYIAHRPKEIVTPYIPYVDIPPQHYILDRETKSIVYSLDMEFYYDGIKVIDKNGNFNKEVCRQDNNGNILYKFTGDLILDNKGNFYTTPISLTSNPTLPRVSCVIITEEGDLTSIGMLVRDAYEMLPAYMTPKITRPIFNVDNEYIITKDGYKIMDGTYNLINKLKETVIYSDGSKGPSTELKEDGLYDLTGGLYIDTKGNVYDENKEIIFDKGGNLITGKIAREWTSLEPSKPIETPNPSEPSIPPTDLEPSIPPTEPSIPPADLEPSIPPTDPEPSIPATPLEPSIPTTLIKPTDPPALIEPPSSITQPTNTNDNNIKTHTISQRINKTLEKEYGVKITDKVPYTLPLNTRINWAELLNVENNDLKVSDNYFASAGYKKVTIEYKGIKNIHGIYVIEITGDSKTYSDVKDTHWAKNSIYNISKEGYLKSQDNNYLPNNSLNLLDVCSSLNNTLLSSKKYQNLLGRNIVNTYVELQIEGNPEDVYVLKSVLSQLSLNTLEKLFEDNDNFNISSITRDDYALIISDLVKTDSKCTVRYTDYEQITNKDAVSKLYSLSIMKGYSGNFYPNKPITKAELASTLDRLTIHIN